MWDPKVNIKGVIVSVNLDSGMSQVVLWFVVLYAGKKYM